MSAKKIVLKVSIMCNKCAVYVMSTIAKFDGITSVVLDKDKSTVTIVGTVDAVLVVKALRKAKKLAEIVTVGQPDKPADDKKPSTGKKPDDAEEKPELCKDLPPYCKVCTYVVYDDYQPNLCIII
ncbi:heavy metal-associated isoprenylated plant protein 43-like [Zingiber officinale]|uniref:heavy metal-associated isoprenylated plant protein 43-like n=1 Tax=Zingiber officinale TaxID=94328 RepID=UPI001C4BB0CC|nr:heavy metal-associated isoprenylated plant protein 43-like [Zingiber officinale]